FVQFAPAMAPDLEGGHLADRGADRGHHLRLLLLPEAPPRLLGTGRPWCARTRPRHRPGAVGGPGDRRPPRQADPFLPWLGVPGRDADLATPLPDAGGPPRLPDLVGLHPAGDPGPPDRVVRRHLVAVHLRHPPAA